MRKIENVTLKNGKSLKEVLEHHEKWLEDEECSDIIDADLENEYLECVNLKDAFL